jgi:hypothetical protein
VRRFFPSATVKFNQKNCSKKVSFSDFMKAEVDKKVAFSDQQKKANILFRVIVEQGPQPIFNGILRL